MIARTIAIASDHAGPEIKTTIKARLEAMGTTVLDLGTNTTDSVDYPDYAEKVAQAIIQGEADMGVIICGTGIGISIAANRHKEIRAALCHNAETATLSRQHNNANVLALGARMLDEATIMECVEAFFTTEYAGGRHDQRIAKIS